MFCLKGYDFKGESVNSTTVASDVEAIKEMRQQDETEEGNYERFITKSNLYHYNSE